MNCVQNYGKNMISPLSQVENITDTHALTDMIAVQDPEDQTVSERQQTFTKYFHELKNQFDFTSHEEFKTLMSKLTRLQ